jgi:hypothetical protein
MEKQLFQKESQTQREVLLHENCQMAEIIDYTRRLTKEELIEKKDRFAEISIKEEGILEEKKAAMEDYKMDLEPLQNEKSKILGQIKSESITLVEECFKFVENGKVGYYDTRGILVLTRPARPDEMQLKMKIEEPVKSSF